MRPTPPLIRWTRASTVLLSGFFLTIFLIIYVWWPLADQLLRTIDWRGPWWLYMDWLLIGLFLFMSLTIVAHADLRTDGLIVLVATVGGLVIEAWGTQTNLWHYYTSERPPLWIVPAWPIATLCIDRITRLLAFFTTPSAAGQARDTKVATESARSALHRLSRFAFNFKTMYWVIFAVFMALTLVFVAPTFDKSYTLLALMLCMGFIVTPSDQRRAVLVFVAGAGLGYFLELWGTTRECWTYYTFETPPLFAVLAHGMAAVAFWRTGLVLRFLVRKLEALVPAAPTPEEDQP